MAPDEEEDIDDEVELVEEEEKSEKPSATPKRAKLDPFAGKLLFTAPFCPR